MENIDLINLDYTIKNLQTKKDLFDLKSEELNEQINNLTSIKNEQFNNMVVFNKQEFLDKYDYDCDGKVSLIDYSILRMAIFGKLDNDPKYDTENNTYNGKSLDLNNNGIVDTTDIGIFNDNTLLNNIFDVIDVFWNIHDKSIDNLINLIIKYYNENNHVLPTLEQLEGLE